MATLTGSASGLSASTSGVLSREPASSSSVAASALGSPLNTSSAPRVTVARPWESSCDVYTPRAGARLRVPSSAFFDPKKLLNIAPRNGGGGVGVVRGGAGEGRLAMEVVDGGWERPALSSPRGGLLPGKECRPPAASSQMREEEEEEGPAGPGGARPPARPTTTARPGPRWTSAASRGPLARVGAGRGATGDRCASPERERAVPLSAPLCTLSGIAGVGKRF